MSVMANYLRAAEESAKQLRIQLTMEHGINSESALKARLLATSLGVARAQCELDERTTPQGRERRATT